MICALRIAHEVHRACLNKSNVGVNKSALARPSLEGLLMGEEGGAEGGAGHVVGFAPLLLTFLLLDELLHDLLECLYDLGCLLRG